ncbi:hypothetical protein DEO72_LG11g2609 [Vigna unguiculata]|uniref:Uncharacterized protein n=1 Tax=Vigna unguiculata TaxID=3917 RepID=A0A4D6NQE9_VIGUN|nr:hypothetical protein DEO72_LG11g2609 [Vigna unguiculata]
MRPDRGSTDNESRSVSAAIGRGIAKLETVLHKWVRSTGYELGFVVVRGSSSRCCCCWGGGVTERLGLKHHIFVCEDIEWKHIAFRSVFFHCCRWLCL